MKLYCTAALWSCYMVHEAWRVPGAHVINSCFYLGGGWHAFLGLFVIQILLIWLPYLFIKTKPLLVCRLP